MSSSIRRAFFLLMTAALLVGAGWFFDPIERMRKQYRLTSSPVQGMSPELVLATTALGAFRGIILDIVWIRMESLKLQGKHFELVQLADWACQLTPRLPKVWGFNAWNLAYNVSVQLPQLPERWYWVNRGVELLRDEGLRYNPNAPSLYEQLAWLYSHKIGDVISDDAHMFYKYELGAMMHEVLEGSGSREELQKLASAPGRRADVLEDPAVKQLIDELKSADFDVMNPKTYLAWKREPDSVSRSVQTVMDDPRHAEALEKVDVFVRSWKLRQEMKLDPEMMVELMDKYGPLDWRTPYAHAIYWASKGREVGKKLMPDLKGEDPAYKAGIFREINHDRIIYNSMRQIVESGRLLFDSKGQFLFEFGPDYRFTDIMCSIYEEIIDKYEGRLQSGIKSAYEYFLLAAMRECYFMGDFKKARKYWGRLKERYPKDDYNMPLEEFVPSYIRDSMRHTGPGNIRRLVRAL